MDDALAALGRHELLVDLTELRRIDLEFEVAVNAGRPEDIDVVRRIVREVRDVGSRVAAALTHDDPNDPLIVEVVATREAAADLRKVLMSPRKNLNLQTATRKLREQLVPTCEHVATRMSRLRLEVEGKN